MTRVFIVWQRSLHGCIFSSLLHIISATEKTNPYGTFPPLRKLADTSKLRRSARLEGGGAALHERGAMLRVRHGTRSCHARMCVCSVYPSLPRSLLLVSSLSFFFLLFISSSVVIVSASVIVLATSFFFHSQSLSPSLSFLLPCLFTILPPPPSISTPSPPPPFSYCRLHAFPFFTSVSL